MELPILNINIKKTSDKAVIPKYAMPGDAGMDLTATSIEKINADTWKYNFNLQLGLPDGYVAFIFPRSSGYKKNQTLTNCVGVVDSGYRGDISAVMKGSNPIYGGYKVGERVAQMIIMPVPNVVFEEVHVLEPTERGEGGYGSTGE